MSVTHASRAIETDQARANAMGAVPHGFQLLRSLAILTSGNRALAIRHTASCQLAAGQARVLAGWPRACIQAVSEF